MKRIKIIIIFSVIIIAAAGGIITYNIINRFEYNDSGAVGNTTGNLYNQGLVCEYGDPNSIPHTYTESTVSTEPSP